VIRINSPIIGEVKLLSDVPDDVFANKLMGEGIAIIPNDNHVYAPCAGKILRYLINQNMPSVLFLTMELKY